MLLTEFLLIVLLTVLSTMAGVLIVILFRDKCIKKQRLLLMIESVVMLGLSFELIIQGLIIDVLQAFIGFFLGIFLMTLVQRLIPHKHSLVKRLSILVIVGFLVHEIPEGASMGISLILDVNYGLLTAFLIGLQNLPEGAVVALPILLAKHSNNYIVTMVFLTQVFFAATAIFSFIFLQGFTMNGALLSMASGAMSYLTYEEVKISRQKKF